MRRFLQLLAATCLAAPVFAQNPLEKIREIVASQTAKIAVKELRLRADPEAKVRPHETLVIQALVYGESETGEIVRVQSDLIEFRIKQSDGGRLSKPFRYQGKEEEAFYRPGNGGRLSSILSQGTVQYAFQDSTLYAAPDEEGKYVIIASSGGVEAELEIEVTKKVDSSLTKETTEFSAEPGDSDRYRSLAEQYAPFIAQEAWFEPKYDYLARFDLDGDFRGDNNWENAPAGSSQAYVYYTVMETETHWFVIYNFFHPRDYSDKCVIGTCHENDNEGLVLTIHKDGSQYGRLRAMETLAHNNVYSHTLDDDVRPNAHNIDGRIDVYEKTHPRIFIEAGGHGVLGASTSHSYYDVEEDEFKSGLGVTYVYKGKAERPKHANDREVGYELLPMWEHWWVRSVGEKAREEGMFDAYYSYRPVGERPVPRYAEIAGSFLGRAESENKAKPFWGWHDNRTRKAGLLATGQWALDPAYSAQVDLRFSEPFSVKYVYNPYLGIGSPEEQPSKGPVQVVTASAGASAPPAVGGSQFAEDGIYAPQVTGGLSGSLDYEAVIEGEAILSIRGGSIEVVTGAPLSPKSSFSGAAPSGDLGALAVDARKGHAEVLAEPSSANQYAAIVRLRPDGDRGKVKFRLEWSQ